MSSLDLFDRDHKVGRFSRDVLALVISRKSQRKRLALARLHAANGIFKFLEHLALAHQKLKSVGLATIERFTVYLAFKINRHPVALFGGGIVRTLGEGAALLAQDFHRAVDSRIRDLGSDLFDRSASQISDLDFRIDLKDGVKRQFALGSAFLLRDSWLPGHPEVGLVGGAGKCLAHLVVHHLVLHRVAIALRHDIHRHLARPESVHLDGPRQLLQAIVHFGLDGFHRQGQRDLAFELFEGFYSYCHGLSFQSGL